jgi:hypothetical protein
MSQGPRARLGQIRRVSGEVQNILPHNVRSASTTPTAIIPPWCVLKDAWFLQVQVLSGKAPEYPVADSSREERSDRAKRSVGWGNCFRTGNADREFNEMDSLVVKSLRRWQSRRGGQRPTKRPPFAGQQLYGMGRYRLQGTVPYPAHATPRRSSLSRVPENGMHGLKGDSMATGQPC